MTEGVCTAAATVSGSTFEEDCCGVPLSRTATVRLKVPDAVGVPERTPVEGLIVTPEGWPETDHVYGAVPPVATTAWAVYAVPAVPVDGLRAAVVMERADTEAATVSGSAFE